MTRSFVFWKEKKNSDASGRSERKEKETEKRDRFQRPLDDHDRERGMRGKRRE